MQTKRVVVTGIGLVGAHGLNADDFFGELCDGKNRIGPIDSSIHFDSSAYPQTVGKLVVGCPKSDAELAALCDERKATPFDRHQLFAFIAADEAMTQAGFSKGESITDPTRFAVIAGTGDGGLRANHDGEKRLAAGLKLGPRDNLKELPNLFAGYLAQRYNLRGASHVHCTACAASAHAITDGADEIRLGRADCVLVGGAEAPITPFGIASFVAQGAVGTDSLPFNQNHSGFIMGEGAAFLVLEDYDHAKARGAKILAELIGYGATSDGNGGGSITAPNPDGGYRAAKLAMAMGGITPDDIDLINPHGTGTPTGDTAEIAGIMRWCDEHDPARTSQILISATKSFTGHWLGAAGALEAVLAIQCIRENQIPPTRGLTAETLHPDCDGGLDHVTYTMKVPVGTVLSNSFGFGGTNATLIFRHAD